MVFVRPLFLTFSHVLALISLLPIVFGCNPTSHKSEKQQPTEDTLLKPVFAKGFLITGTPQVAKLQIFDPLRKHSILHETILVSTSENISLPEFKPDTIFLPVSHFITLSATQWGMLLKIGEAMSIKGISEAPFVQDSLMQSLLSQGQVVEVARDGLFRLELLSKHTGALMLFNPDAAGLPEPVRSLPINSVPWPDYFETHPLGRAEWIKVLGFLTGKQKLADSIFEQISTEYIRLERMAAQMKNKPTIFSDKPFAGQWYIPGARSYLARIFADAGAKYVFESIDASGSVPLDLEAIMARAMSADYWRIAHNGDIGGYEALLKENPVFGNFAAFKKRQVIFCNTRSTAYFERSPLEPHIVLADFIAIFHPHILPMHQPKYHQLLK